ncbi:MAG: cyclic pyranopterin monophosphate synthase MoaC [Gammaproteobacteria bacterium]
MARMIDVGSKPRTQRRATAQAIVCMNRATLNAVLDNRIVKGDVVSLAQVAGIMGAKMCPQMLPLCHPLPLASADVTVESWHQGDEQGLRVLATASVEGQTGVEMESLAACATAALCIYDMCKSMDPAIRIEQMCLLEKDGGKSGLWQRALPQTP